MKKGFTMIELIFVIVILGVLAAVAIPKLNATRDDAEQAKAMTNLATLMGDLTSYYTSQGKFEEDVTKMTNVPLEKGATAGNYGFNATTAPTNLYAFNIKNKPCLAVGISGANVVIASALDTAGVGASPVCGKILGNTSTQNILSGSYTCNPVVGQKKANETPVEDSNKTGATSTNSNEVQVAAVKTGVSVMTATSTAPELEWKGTYVSGATLNSALDTACTDEATRLQTENGAPKAEGDKLTVIVPIKIDGLNQAATMNFQGAGVKF